MTGDSREFAVLQAQRAMRAASLLRRLEEARTVDAAFPPDGDVQTTDLLEGILGEARELGAVTPDPTAYLADLVAKAIRDGVVDTHPAGQARGSY